MVILSNEEYKDLILNQTEESRFKKWIREQKEHWKDRTEFDIDNMDEKVEKIFSPTNFTGSGLVKCGQCNIVNSVSYYDLKNHMCKCENCGKLLY